MQMIAALLQGNGSTGAGLPGCHSTVSTEKSTEDNSYTFLTGIDGFRMYKALPSQMEAGEVCVLARQVTRTHVI